MDSYVIKWDSSLHRGSIFFSFVLQAVTAGHLMVLCQKKKKKLGSKTTAAAVPPLSITVTLALAAWGPKFLFDLKCQHRCPDNFHSVTLPVCPQMQRALIGAGKRWGCLSISLVGEMKQPHSDPLSPQKRIPASNKYRFSVLILARTKFILPILKQHIWIRRRDCIFPKGFANVLVIHLPRCCRAAVQAWRILSDVFSFNVIQSRRKQSHIFEMRNGEEKKNKFADTQDFLLKCNYNPVLHFLHRHGTTLWAPSRKWRSWWRG